MLIYTRKIPRKNVEKDRINGLRHSTDTKVIARGSDGYPRVRQSAQKSPKGAAGLAQQVHKFEVFSKRLSVQKSPKGAAGLAQQVRKFEVFSKRLFVQKSPKGAAGLAQQVRKSKSSPKDNPRKSSLRVQPDQRNECKNQRRITSVRKSTRAAGPTQ
jgi:hypothetical protein